MMRIEIHEGLASRAVHTGWIARALPDVGDPELRSALLASERFSRRIADSILGDPVSVEHVEPSVDFCKLVRQLDDDLLVRIGQIWLAPQLAPHLIDPKGRADLGIEDRIVLQSILKYRGHASMPVVEFTAPPDYPAEGARCIAAWLEMQAFPAASRLRLCFEPSLSTDEDDANRAALLDALLSDDGFMAG